MTLRPYTPIDRHPLRSGYDWLRLLSANLGKLSDEQNSLLFCQTLNSAALLLLHAGFPDYASECLFIQFALADSDDEFQEYLPDALLNVARLRLRSLSGDELIHLLCNSITYISGNNADFVHTEDKNLVDLFKTRSPAHLAALILYSSLTVTSNTLDSVISCHITELCTILGRTHGLLIEYYPQLYDLDSNPPGNFIFENIVSPLQALDAYGTSNDTSRQLIARILAGISLLIEATEYDHRFWRSHFRTVGILRDVGDKQLCDWLIAIGRDLMREDAVIQSKLDCIAKGRGDFFDQRGFYVGTRLYCENLIAHIREISRSTFLIGEREKNVSKYASRLLVAAS